MDFSSLYDPLFCEEDEFEVEETEHHLPLTVVEEHEQYWGEEGDEEWVEALSSLLANEAETFPKHFSSSSAAAAAGDVYLSGARGSAVEWVVKTSAKHGFSVQTLLLAVNYLDRCFLAGDNGGLRLREDKPWMGRLAAVACLSLAAKVEESRVPLLLDLQITASTSPVFENKTIRRMELLVLSTLRWRMNPVTPLSLARRLVRNIPVTAGGREDLIAQCEVSLVTVLADWRWILYPPSVWATAALHSVRQPEHISGESPENHLTFDILNISKDKVGAAYRLIQELSVSNNGFCCKRKHSYYSQCGGSLSCCCCCKFSSGSPNGPVGTCFTCETTSSNNSANSSFPPEQLQPPFKKPNVNQIRDNGDVKDQLVIDHGVVPWLDTC